MWLFCSTSTAVPVQHIIASLYIASVLHRQMSRGLAKVGYQYVNVDDCWQLSRNETGFIQSDPKTFPDMHGLASYIHSKDMLFGLYSSAGTNTCQGKRMCVLCIVSA